MQSYSNIIKIITFLCVGILASYTASAQSEQREEDATMNVIYGKNHILTIETPVGWINDREIAQKIGLTNLFYAKADTALMQKSYMYVNGYDKASTKDILQDFIDDYIQSYRIQYPDCKFEIEEVGGNGGVKNAILYSFFNLNDRYREEVLYSETESAVIILVFSATTQTDYENYQSVFDDFIQSFTYRGDNPKPFLDYMNAQRVMQ